MNILRAPRRVLEDLDPSNAKAMFRRGEALAALRFSDATQCAAGGMENAENTSGWG